ncbi:unnamed protein product [Owenia fusiformis]|uniref:Uncharacterized protein n=1 Tax=Owenia fusiformis TaxID=6347 RepID=A0A8J1TUY5_OWEFU|nr:unnamed protein product [Owenia fusiformis]
MDEPIAMNENRRHLFDRYFQLVVLDYALYGQFGKNRAQIKEETRTFLSTTRPDSCYYKAYLEIIQLNVNKDPYWNAKDGKDAFEKLEIYALNVQSKPWKKLYNKIKKYNGAFYTLVKVHLERAEVILEDMGYVPNQMTYTIDNNAKRNSTNLQKVAFECFFASIECEIIHEIYLDMRNRNFTVAQVLKCRLNFQGGVGESGEWMEEKLKPEGTRHIVEVHRENEDIDPESIHLRHAPKSHVGRAKLLKTDSGYGSKLSQQVVRKQPQWSDEQYISHSINARETPDKVISLVRDQDQIEPSMEEDIYGAPDMPGGDGIETPMTIDDQLQFSLNLVKDGNLQRPTSDTKDDEWTLVRSTLKSRYGEKYYDGVGQRPDLLKQGNKDSPSKSDDLLKYTTKSPKESIHYKSAPPIVSDPQDYNTKSIDLSSEIKHPPPPVTNTRKNKSELRKDPSIEAIEEKHKELEKKHRAELNPVWSRDGSTGRELRSRGRDRDMVQSTYDNVDGNFVTEQHAMHTTLYDAENVLLNKIQDPVPSPTFKSPRSYSEAAQVKASRGPPVSPRPSSTPKAHPLSKPLQSNNYEYQAQRSPKEVVTKSVTTGGRSEPSSGHVFDKYQDENQLKTWQCAGCTFANTYHNKVCEMCDKTRSTPGSLERDIVKPYSKECALCTYVNKPEAKNCEVCNCNLNGGGSTVV